MVSKLNFQNIEAVNTGKPFFTTGDVDLYVDNINGDDTNDGSSGSPLKTLVEAEARLPLAIDHRVVIHVLPYDASVPNVGSYEWPTFRERTMRDNIFVIGDDYQIYASGTVQAGSDSTKIVTSGGLTEDDYVVVGASIRITSGTCAGNVRTISQNTVTDIIPANPFSPWNPGPAAGDTYEIIRPVVRYSVPTSEMFATLARGTKEGLGASGTKVEPSLWIINATLVVDSGFLQISDHSVLLMGVVFEGHPSEGVHIATNAALLLGFESKARGGYYTTGVPTAAEVFPSLSPTITSWFGWGISMGLASLQPAAMITGLEGFIVTAGYIAIDPGWTTGAGSKIASSASIHGGRASGVYMGDRLGRLSLSTSFIYPRIPFLILATQAFPPVSIYFGGRMSLSQTKIVQPFVSEAISISGDAAWMKLYGVDVSSQGMGLVTKQGGVASFYASGTNVFSTALGDLSEDGGVTVRPISALTPGTCFRDMATMSSISRDP